MQITVMAMMRPLKLVPGLTVPSLILGSRDSAVSLDAKIAVAQTTTTNMSIEKITKPDAEWQKLLTPEQYRVTRKHGTERAFTCQYWNTKDAGTYRCVACDVELFS